MRLKMGNLLGKRRFALDVGMEPLWPSTRIGGTVENVVILNGRLRDKRLTYKG